MLMLLLGLGGAWLRWRGQLYQQRLFLRFAAAMGPAGIIAILAGWMTTEIGRQPWVVYGVMRTADAVSHHSALALSVSLLVFVVVYFAVFGTGISYLLKLVAQGPDRGAGTARARRSRTSARRGRCRRRPISIRPRCGAARMTADGHRPFADLGADHRLWADDVCGHGRLRPGHRHPVPVRAGHAPTAT